MLTQRSAGSLVAESGAARGVTSGLNVTLRAFGNLDVSVRRAFPGAHSPSANKARLDPDHRAFSATSVEHQPIQVERDLHMMFPSIRSLGVGLALCGATAFFALPASAAANNLQASASPTAGRLYSAIPGSFMPTTNVAAGAFQSAGMTIEVVLAPRNGQQLSALLQTLYDPNSPQYAHWLPRGQFDALFAPTSAGSAAVAAYLRQSGLLVEPSTSPFFVRATGSSTAVAAAFRTTLLQYRSSSGVRYFSNASAAQIPTSLGASVLGVVGLSNTVRLQPQFRRSPLGGSATASCEAPYPTELQLSNSIFEGIVFPTGYGGSPGCNGLTPSQDNSIYGAPNAGRRTKGAGVNLAVFELSAYQRSDIATWAHTFYGRAYAPPLVDVNVDGGPLNPACPAGDSCTADPYSEDIEVDADIEMQLAISPDARHIIVYNGPFDGLGITALDEYVRIANDDIADVVSTSWALCENDVGSGVAQIENIIFEKMAAQGQSMFGGAGDTGAFECLRENLTANVNVLDPPAQPWVTSVGGTSFESYNPGLHANPAYPAGGETVWNVDNLCNTSAGEDGLPGPLWCYVAGAGGGGNSQFWGRPPYQYGPGITNPYTTYGNGTTQCSLAAIGQPCREVPDISANADEFTPYAEFCTSPPGDANSACVKSSSDIPPGWFGIGGTSLSSPLWSAIVADRDSYQGRRTGNANPLLYLLYNRNPHGYFHDITGIHQSTNNNGLFPVTPGYDLATGIGTPDMAALILGVPQR